MPDAGLSAYELPPTPQSAARVIVRRADGPVRVYVHPVTLEVLGAVPDDRRFTRWLFRLHGELLMGDRGSMIVELAASWTIVMILTGLYLWWPRQGADWRESSILGCGPAREPCGATCTASPASGFRSWPCFSCSAACPGRSRGAIISRPSAAGPAPRLPGKTGRLAASGSRASGGERGEHAGHGHGGRGRRGTVPPLPADLTAVDRVLATVGPLGLPPPVQILPPTEGATRWTAKSMTPNRPERVTLTVDGASGQIESREDFGDRQLIDRIVGIGIAAHEGQLFGWPNQLLGLVTAGGLLLVSLSGVVMWWRRREAGVLGAPRVMLSARVSWGLVALVAILGVYLPLFGSSLLVVLATERTLLRRIPGVARWLGLAGPAAVAPV